MSVKLLFLKIISNRVAVNSTAVNLKMKALFYSLFGVLLISVTPQFPFAKGPSKGLHIKLSRLECSFKEKFAVNFSCYIKPIGRYEVSMTIIFDVVLPQKDMRVL